MTQLQQLDLNGAWMIRGCDGNRGRLSHALLEPADESKYLPAQVPGEVHLDLMRAGLIADPALETNCLSARWVEEMFWSYRREFVVPPEALTARSWLVFAGLDLVASIFLNGKEIGKHNNFFCPCRIDVTGKLRAGNNVLVVQLESGLYSVSEQPGYSIHPVHETRLHKRIWLRKPQCQFNWDWSPRLINVGIHKPVHLEWTSLSARLDVLVPLAEVSDDLKTGRLRGRLFVEGLSAEPVKGRLELEIPEAGVRTSQEVEIKPGLASYEAVLNVNEPKLWWPVGHGPQNRYGVRATLWIDGKVVGERSAKIGFRHVRVNQDRHPAKGTYFILEVNRRKIFCKGGNFVPADLIFARIDKARYERLIELALEQNFNFLRVWGGGLYESEDFYELCDQHGILVWQEFIFACARYPGTDDAFVKNVKQEALYNVRRLASRPSLIAWCGNNENEMGAWEWGYDEGAVLPDHALYHHILPRIVKAEDGTRYYQPSSPFSPEHQSPNADETGDQHPWSLGFVDTDYRKYRDMICRFSNEGGVLGPTSLPTMLACLPPKDRRIGSFSWELHENAIAQWAEPKHVDKQIEQWTGRKVAQLSVEDFVYWAGLVQGEGLREYIDNFRRRMFDSSSAIFWMYNDTWPCTRSWTTVDYYLRRTPSFYPVRRAMAAQHVVLAQVGEEVKVFGINDEPMEIECELRFGLFNLGGGFVLDQRRAVNLKPNRATPLASFKMSEWRDPAATLAFAMLSRQNELLARNRLVLPFFKDLRWAPSRLRVSTRGEKAIFESESFVWGVCLDLNGEGKLADNFFDVYPGIPYELPWSQPQPPKVLRIGNAE